MTLSGFFVLAALVPFACPFDCGGPSCRHRPTVTHRLPGYLALLHGARLRYRSYTCRRLP